MPRSIILAVLLIGLLLVSTNALAVSHNLRLATVVSPPHP